MNSRPLVGAPSRAPKRNTFVSLRILGASLLTPRWISELDTVASVCPAARRRALSFVTRRIPARPQPQWSNQDEPVLI